MSLRFPYSLLRQARSFTELPSLHACRIRAKVAPPSPVEGFYFVGAFWEPGSFRSGSRKTLPHKHVINTRSIHPFGPPARASLGYPTRRPIYP